MRHVLASATLIAVLGGCSVLGVRSGYEEPAYTVVETIDETVEIRHYRARLAAETPLDDDAPDQAFRSLFTYIAGANRARSEVPSAMPGEASSQRIDMTVPVEVVPSNADPAAFRFFLPASYTRATAPEPTDPRVRLVEVPEATLAVLRFSGSWSEANLEARRAELLATLAGTTWRPTGEASNWFYDPPWTLAFLRRNEVVVPVITADDGD